MTKLKWEKDKFGFATRAIHAGQEPDPTTGAIMTPIYMSSTFVQASPGVHKGYDYARGANPTRAAFEECFANLESGKHGVAFASGCAATATIVHLVKAGEHVVSMDDMYGGTYRLFDKVFKHHGIDFSYVDLSNPENFKAAIKPNTKLVWIETPTNPSMKLVDIKKISALAREKGIICAVDNTFMTPYFQRPLELGADITVHSSTKYIGGHSDLIGGVLATNSDEINEKLRFVNKSIGGTPSVFDSFMFLRSLKTLPLRMRAHDENGRVVAEFLSKHPKIAKVMYPGLASHPQHGLAKEQMSGFGGMVTVSIKGGIAEARRFLENVRVFSLAESLGGVESLINHPGIMTHASIPAEMRKQLGIDDTMIRLSVGVEDIDDIVNDLKQALQA